MKTKKRSTASAKDWNVPDWRNPKLYPPLLPVGNEPDLDQWRWEFLRRDDKYRDDWQRFLKLRHPFKLSLTENPSSQDFDLPKFPLEFPERHNDVWYVLSTYKMGRLINPAIASPDFLRFYPIPARGVLIWFDLEQNVEDEIAYARKLLQWHQMANRKWKLRRKRLPAKGEWPMLLRILDAHNIGATYATIGYEILGIPSRYTADQAATNALSKWRTASAMWKNIPLFPGLPSYGYALMTEDDIDDLVPPGYKRTVLPRL